MLSTSEYQATLKTVEKSRKKKKKKKLTKEEKRLCQIQKLVEEGVLDEIQSMNLKELRTRVNDCAKNIKAAQDEFHVKHGAEEERLKEALRELRQPLKDAIRYQEAIRDYALMRQGLLEDA